MKLRAIALSVLIAASVSGCDRLLEPPQEDPRAIWARGASTEAIGRAYIEVLPNRATFSVTFEARDVASDVASAEVVELANAASAAVRLATEDNARITSNLSVQPYYEQVREQRGEFREVLVENRHPTALLGYVARVTVNVDIRDLEFTASARGAALAAGPANSGPIRFSMQPTAELYREAFAAAVNDATERARLVAEASGASLGELLVLLEGQQPCLRPPATPAGLDNGDYGNLGRNAGEDRIVVMGSRIARSQTVSVSPVTAISEEQLALLYTATPEEFLEVSAGFALAADFTPMRFETSVCAIFAIDE